MFKELYYWDKLLIFRSDCHSSNLRNTCSIEPRNLKFSWNSRPLRPTINNLIYIMSHHQLLFLKEKLENNACIFNKTPKTDNMYIKYVVSSAKWKTIVLILGTSGWNVSNNCFSFMFCAIRYVLQLSFQPASVVIYVYLYIFNLINIIIITTTTIIFITK